MGRNRFIITVVLRLKTAETTVFNEFFFLNYYGKKKFSFFNNSMSISLLSDLKEECQISVFLTIFRLFCLHKMKKKFLLFLSSETLLYGKIYVTLYS